MIEPPHPFFLATCSSELGLTLPQCFRFRDVVDDEDEDIGDSDDEVEEDEEEEEEEDEEEAEEEEYGAEEGTGERSAGGPWCLTSCGTIMLPPDGAPLGSP